jgi:hypothetical protein
MGLGLVTSVGPSIMDNGEFYSVKEKIRLTNLTIEDKGASLWGVNFQVNTSNLIKRIGGFPIDLFFYVTSNAKSNPGKVAYTSKLVCVDSSSIKHISSKPEYRPKVWRDLSFKTYLKLSEKIRELNDPKPITQFKNDKGVFLTEYSAQNYTIINY